MSELRPCDHCKGEAGLYRKMLSDDLPYHVECHECGARTRDCADKPEAIAAWNTRATDAELDSLRAEVERLREREAMTHRIKLATDASFADLRKG